MTENTNMPPGVSMRAKRREQGADLRHVHDRHRTNGLVEPVRPQRRDRVGVGSVHDVVLDRGVPGRALARARDEFCTVVEGDDPRAELRHPPGESSRAARDIQDGVSGTDLEETFSRWLNQQRLEVVAVADPVVPPAGVRIPYPTIVIAAVPETPRAWAGWSFGLA